MSVDSNAEAARAEYEEARERSVQGWCRCACDVHDHVEEWTGDGWNEPRGVEMRCDGPCDDACTNEEPRRRCGACGAWCNASDVVVLEPLEGEICPACGELGEMEKEVPRGW